MSGLAIAQAVSLEFSVDDATRQIFAEPMAGEVAQSTVGMPSDLPPQSSCPRDGSGRNRPGSVAAAFDDTFENVSEAFSIADVVWPGETGVLVDTVPPRLEEICSQGDVLKVTFSEPVSASLASAALAVDGNSVTWQSENGGITLRTTLSEGSHQLATSGAPLDLAGLGIGSSVSPTFTIDDDTHGIYRLPFPGEAAQSTVGNVFGFQGLPEDGETGLLYVRNRYYDPEMGRFITPDPLGFVDGPNVYQFALNSPVNYSDPMGLSMQASDYAGIAGEGARTTGEQLFQLGDLGLGGKLSAFIEGKNAFSEAREADYGIVTSFYYAAGRAKRQARAVQSLGFSEAADPVAHAKALGMGLLDSLTGRDQFAKGIDAWEHGEKWEAVGRYTAGIGAIISNVAPVAAAKAARAARVARSTTAAVGAAEAAQMDDAARALNKIDPDCWCFVAGTPIATAQGEKLIEAIEIGDEVWARNPETGEVELAKVAGLFQRQADGVLTLNLGGGDADLEVTPPNPMFVPARGWVVAGDLRVGDELLGMDGEPVRIEAIHWQPGDLRVYNFEVEGLHSYFAGQVEVLVHNCLVGDQKLLAEGSGFLADHHIFPQKFRPYFARMGIAIDRFTMSIDHATTHLKGIHGRGNLGQLPGGWNKRWAEWIATHGAQATAKDAFQFAGSMMDEYKLSGLRIHPWGQ